MVAVGRRLVHAPGPGHLGRAHADAVHLDVIGVAVVAVLVVDREHVGVLLLEDAGQPGRGLVDVGARERARRVVGRLAGHAGVDVVEELDPVDAEDVGGRVQLGDAPLDELLARREGGGVVLAELALRRRDEHHSVAVALGARHRAARGDRLVVGVGVKQNECVRHARTSLPVTHAPGAAWLLSGADI